MLGDPGEKAVMDMVAKGSAELYWENGIEMMSLQSHEAGKRERNLDYCKLNQAAPRNALCTEYYKFICDPLQIHSFHIFQK